MVSDFLGVLSPLRSRLLVQQYSTRPLMLEAFVGDKVPIESIKPPKLYSGRRVRRSSGLITPSRFLNTSGLRPEWGGSDFFIAPTTDELRDRYLDGNGIGASISE